MEELIVAYHWPRSSRRMARKIQVEFGRRVRYKERRIDQATGRSLVALLFRWARLAR